MKTFKQHVTEGMGAGVKTAAAKNRLLRSVDDPISSPEDSDIRYAQTYNDEEY